MGELNSYDLSRQFFDWCFENPELINPNHIALYFFIIEHCNRLGWKEKFGLPTTMVKDAIGIKNYRTYINTLNDLIEWQFIKMVQKSTNQYSANIIALVKNTKAHTKALDKALIKHGTKQSQSIDSIDKQITINKEQITIEQAFGRFWDLYGKKKEYKKCRVKFEKLQKHEIEKIFLVLPKYIEDTPVIRFRKNPLTWLNGECWNDEILQPTNEGKKYNVVWRNELGRYTSVKTSTELEVMKTALNITIESAMEI